MPRTSYLTKVSSNFNHARSESFNAFDHEILTNNQTRATEQSQSSQKSIAADAAAWPLEKAFIEPNSNFNDCNKGFTNLTGILKSFFVWYGTFSCGVYQYFNFDNDRREEQWR